MTSLKASLLEGKTAVYHTLGCKLNFAETSSLADRLRAVGIGAPREGCAADICVINTCSVTEMADHKCRQIIHKMVRENPGAVVVVMGCYAQLQPQRLAAIEGVDLVLGMEHKGELPERLAELMERRALQGGCAAALHEQVVVPTARIRSFVPSCSCGGRTRYFLKVQDGCDYYCTYCTIPIARGRSRNPRIASLVEQAEAVARAGGKEIVITGVNIGDFGRSTGEHFIDLLRALDGVRGIERYRISSIEPNLLTDEVIAFCASSRAFMPHFHIPLQAGSDAVLRLMHRRYDTAFFARKIDTVRRLMPDAFVGVDVIVGTRGETDALFEEAYRFASSLDVAQFHVFSYSERPGTAALRINNYVVPTAAKHERSRRLIELSEHKRRAFYQRYAGTERPALLEHTVHGGRLHGFTDNYIRIELPATPEATALDNHVVRLRLGALTPDGSALQAQIIPQ